MVRLNPIDDPQWDEKLASCPGGSFFHGRAWAQVLHATYGFTPAYIAAVEAAGFRAMLPMMEVNSWMTGRRGVSLPFTDESEPICHGSDEFTRTFQCAKEQAAARGWKYIELRGGREWMPDIPASVSHLGHRLTLDQDESRMFSGLDSATRRAVRKAEQSGLTVEFRHDLESVQAFYALLCRTRRRHGLPPQPFQFFRNIQRYVLGPKQGCVVLARLGSLPVAGAIYFHFQKTAIYKFGASDEAFQHLRSNNLVMWEAIRWLLRQGFKSLGFGRTSRGNEGLRRFKLGWGAQESPIDYFKYDLPSGRFVGGEADHSSGWHSRIFRHLPPAVSRMIGGVLYKHVA